MDILKRIILFWENISNVPTTDPDDARRGKLLNIILLGMIVVAIITLVVVTVLALLKVRGTGDPFIFVTVTVILVGSIIFYLINRYWSGRIASVIFILFFMGALVLSDSPHELASGRSMFIFVLPIIMAGVLLGSHATLIFYVLTSIEMIVLSIIANDVPNFPAITSFLFLATISWLSARGLEQALKDLRTINAELDQRVADRTRELSESLARESDQASQREAILQGIADGVLVFDTKGTSILANSALSRLLDVPLDRLVRQNFQEVLDPQKIGPEDRDIMADILRKNDDGSTPVRIRWGGKTLSVSAAPVRSNYGSTLGNVAVFRDFTREAELEEMKNSFVAMVSHELRTPLSAILGYSEMIRDAFYGPVNDKQANAADRILNNSRRLLVIVSDLLDKAQIEAGRLKLNYSEFSTVELLGNMHDVMDKITRDKQLELHSELDPQMPDTLYGDPQRLQQIMVNLVNNAAKFTTQGGISVHIYKVTEESWAFDVTDTGPGISAEDQKYIFDPFRQVDKTVTRSHGGIGLGLSIVNKLVELMGGRIFVKSAIGKGSTFTVILPFTSPKKEEKS